TGVRLTCSCWAMRSSDSRSPGRNLLLKIASRTVVYTNSARDKLGKARAVAPRDSKSDPPLADPVQPSLPWGQGVEALSEPPPPYRRSVAVSIGIQCTVRSNKRDFLYRIFRH